MYAVGQRYVWSSQTKAVEIRDISQASFTFNHLAFCRVLRGVGVDHHATLTSQMCNFLQQLASATDCEARRKTITNAAITFTVPSLDQGNRLLDRCRRLF